MSTSLRDLAEPGDPYDVLPAFIKAIYSRKEWLWLSDAEKAALVQTETEPEWVEP